MLENQIVVARICIEHHLFSFKHHTIHIHSRGWQCAIYKYCKLIYRWIAFSPSNKIFGIRNTKCVCSRSFVLVFVPFTGVTNAKSKTNINSQYGPVGTFVSSFVNCSSKFFFSANCCLVE